MLVAVLMVVEHSQRPVPGWVVYPEREWLRVTPEQAGLDPERWRRYLASKSPREPATLRMPGQQGFGASITRGGYLIHTWGDPERAHNSASVGKAFTSIALQLALDRGLIASPHDLVSDYWTGEGQLDSPHKRLDRGLHATLTFAHLHDMTGGFAVSNGWSWRRCEDVPGWATCTGDPSADNYAQAEPGSRRRYSSGGRWRLAQALTAIWGRDLKEVLDAELFGALGIPPEAWTMYAGRVLRETEDFYADQPGYGAFCDPPYEIAGRPVRGGGGWVVMSPNDLARVGLLVASRGRWRGERLVRDTDLLGGWGGGNGSHMGGRGGSLMFSWGAVTIDGVGGTPHAPIDPAELAELVTGPVRAAPSRAPAGAAHE